MPANKNKNAEAQEVRAVPEAAAEEVQENKIAPEALEAPAAIVQAPVDPFAEKVMLFIPPTMSKGEEKDVVIYINGRNWIMPKGGTYEVPKPVAAEYHRSLKARGRSMKRKSDMVQKEQKINAHADAVINGKA